MPGFLVEVGALGSCVHNGALQIQSTNLKVFTDGKPVATKSAQCKIAGCLNVKPPPDNSPWPCTDVKWIMTASRVKVNGEFALLHTGPALCTGVAQPPPTPLQMKMTQSKVRGM